MKKITNVPYMYRDADNYKTFEEGSLRGEITDAQRRMVETLLDHDNYGEPIGFIPEQIGWTHPLTNESWTIDGDVDHHWCELGVADIYTREVSDEVHDGLELDVDGWIGLLIRARTAGWNAANIDPANLQISL